MSRLLYLFFFLFIYQVVEAKPYPNAAADLPVPNITTPWGNYLGEAYGPNEDYYIIRNIRYGKAPVGPLRFAAPQYPSAIKDPKQVQDNSFGPNCIQAAANKNVSVTPPGNGTAMSEDCLFLDIYVPEWALELGPEELQIPVIVWLYGGAYIFGGKNTTFRFPDGNFSAYDGAGIREMSNNNVIWVTGNYRMGAYGFLAGTSMESKSQPNAGLLDQRLILDFVQKYIGQVNGDKGQVSLWGLSAGAGSILHHMTACGSDAKNSSRLFNHAVLWSTAFQWAYDRAGALEKVFQNFAAESSCGKSSDAITCLRSKPIDDQSLKKANQKIVSDGIELGMFPFGPAVDGNLVPELPAAALKKGNHVPLDSITLIHDVDEASLFVAKWVQTSADFTKFLNLAFPGDSMSKIRQDIEKKYPAPKDDDDDEGWGFPVQRRRMRMVLRDSTFVCNKYQAIKAYAKTNTSIYAMRYDMIPTHGADLAHIVWSEQLDVEELLKTMLPDVLDWLAPFLATTWVYTTRTYQAYFASLAISGGDPNLLAGRRARYWDKAKLTKDGVENTIRVRLYPGSFFDSFTDPQVSAANCEFWDDVATQISALSNKEFTLDDVSNALMAQVPALELR